MTSRPSARPAALALAFLVCLLGILFRLQGVTGDLWLDEIFSLKLVSSLRSWSDVFAIHLDNNHFLNSLYLYAVGPDAQPSTCRACSLICGILTLVLAIWTCGKKGAGELLFGSAIFAGSYILILYGTEARGYSSLLLFCLCSFIFFQAAISNGRVIHFIGYYSSCLLGLLSHFTFLHLYVALLAWNACLLWRGKISARTSLVLQGIPLLAALWLGLGLLSKLQVAGGPQGSRIEVFLNVFCVPYGTTELSPSNIQLSAFYLGVAVLVLVILMTELWRKLRTNLEEGVFFAALVIGAPLTLLLFINPEVFVLRYVLPSIFFGYFLFTDFLTRLYRRDRAGRVLAVGLLSLFILGNERSLGFLCTYGRGQYQKAISLISKGSEASEISVSSDQDFRINSTLDYYAARVAPEKKFVYVPGNGSPAAGADWVIFETQDLEAIPAQHLEEQNLILAGTFNTAPLSGMRWFVYCQSARCPTVVELP